MRLFGFFTQNSMKTLYVLEAVGAEFEFVFTDLTKGAQRSEEFRSMNPMGKVPLLDHDGSYLSESGAICRYVANVMQSPLYPAAPFERAIVDQWIDFFSCNAGRWLTTLYFQTVIKPKFGLGDADPDKVSEAEKFAEQALSSVDQHLAMTDWLANGAYSIADLFAFAYVEQERDIEFSIGDFGNLQRWYRRLDASDEIARARDRLPQSPGTSNGDD